MSPANPAIVERNRRAVHHALSGTFTAPETIAGAMTVWETRFAQQAGFRISLYATAVAAELGLSDTEIRDLASNLYASMTMTEDRLPRLPPSFNGKGDGHSTGATGTQPRLDKLSSPPARNARAAVLAKLVDCMVDQAARQQQLDELIEALMLKEVDFSEDVARQRMVWINRRLADSQALAALVPESAWRALVNDLYVALCDACGPVSADRTLAQAVQAAEQIPEARAFSPRLLL